MNNELNKSLDTYINKLEIYVCDVTGRLNNGYKVATTDLEFTDFSTALRYS